MFVEEVETGIRRNVEVLKTSKKELNRIKKNGGWKFDWDLEAEYEVYKLVFDQHDRQPLGLISLGNGIEGEFVEVMHLESAAENIGKNKKYSRVAGNLWAFACQVSFERNFDGYVAFESKTRLKEHYSKVYGAKDTGMRCMYLDTPAAYSLVSTFYTVYYERRSGKK